MSGNASFDTNSTPPETEKTPSAVLTGEDALRDFVRQEVSLVRFKYGTKKGVSSDFLDQPITTIEHLEATFAAGPFNYGVLVDKNVPGSVVDVEAEPESPLAIPALEAYLPFTPVYVSRKGKPKFRRLYRTTTPMEKFSQKHVIEVNTDRRGCIVLGRNPDDGTDYELTVRGDIPTIDAEELDTAVRRATAVTLLAAVWQGGMRSNAAGALGGGLARGGWTNEDIEKFVRMLMQLTKDEDPGNRIGYALRSADGYRAGQPNITGWPELGRLVDDARAVRQIRHLLRMTASSRPPSIADLEDSDYGNGWLLVERHSDRLLFDPTVKNGGRWYVWDGTRWKSDDMARVFECWAETMQAFASNSLATKPTRHQQDDLRRAAAALNKSKGLAAVWAAGHQYNDLKVDPNELDSDPYLFNVHNGTIDLRTGELRDRLRDHNRLDFITRVAGTSYVPDAPFSQSAQFLLDVMNGETERVAYLQRLVGYCMVGEQVDHVLPIFYGLGRNGKDSLYTILRALFGDYAIKTTSATFLKKHDASRATPEIVELRGIRLAYGSETEEGMELAEAKVKELTGGGEIAGRNLFESNQQWVPTHTLILSTNNKPVIKGQDPAIWERVHLLPFEVTFVDNPDESKNQRRRIPKIADTLVAEELPGWLNWALEGFKAWRTVGLNPPDAIVAATAAYRAEMDKLGDFMAAECEIDQELKVSQVALWSRYTRWVEANEEDGFDTKAKFKEALMKRNVRYQRDSATGLMTWFGVGLKEHPKPFRSNGPVGDEIDEMTVPRYVAEQFGVQPGTSPGTD